MIHTAAEIQGWYFRNATSEPVRVRLSVEGRSVSLYTLSGRLVASWSLDHLENREITVLGEGWSISDARLPEAYLVLEGDHDYRAVRGQSARLRPIRARLWRQLGLASIESGNLTGWPVLLLIALGGAVPCALWWFLFG